MKRALLLSIALLTTSAAWAENYNIRSTWDDPTPAGENYAPVYDVRMRVNQGTPAETLGSNVPDVVVPATANPGDSIEVSVRARNTAGGDTPGNWSAWASAFSPVVPLDQTNIRVIITIAP